MTIEDRLHQAADRLNVELEQAPVPPFPERRVAVQRVVAVVAAVLVLGVASGVLAWLLQPGGERTPVVDEASVVDETSLVDEASVTRRPVDLVPTGVYLLTRPSEYLHATTDGDGFVWTAGWQQVARIDPATGEIRVWDRRDDDAFGEQITGLAPARGGGVWMIQPDYALRWFDGERFRDVVETRSLAPDEGIEAVAETPDGRLLASLSDRGVFRWDGSSWTPIDETDSIGGAGALAVDADGVLWAGLPGRGVSRYDGEAWETFTVEDAAALDGVVLTIEPLPDGAARVVTRLGVAYFDGTSWADVGGEGLPLRGSTSAAVGPAGTIWVAAASGGTARVARFDGTAWRVFGPDDGLPAGSRWVIATPTATESGVFVGTGAGVYRLTSGDRWTRVLPLPDEAPPVAPEGAPLAGVAGLQASGGFLWAWGEDEIWRYDEGRWSRYADAPERDDTGVNDLAYGGDTLWVAVDFGVLALEDDGWLEVTAARGKAWRMAADPGMGTLWLSTGTDLYRWDGNELTGVRHPANWPGAGSGYVGDIVVTDDGTVWAAGLYGYLPEFGGLARYDDGTASWEPVRPLGGDVDVPATGMAPAPDGGLWVMLADWADHDQWDERAAAGLTPAALTLARRDGATGEWLVFGEYLPEGYPAGMASGRDAVWISRGSNVDGFERVGGIARFDGDTWTTYLEDTPADDTVDAIAVADDGTVWYTVNGDLHRLEP